MKPRLGTAILLFITSYSPLFIIFVMKDFNFCTYTFSNHLRSIIFLVVIFICIIISVISIKIIPNSNMIIRIVGFTNKSGEFVSYSIPYLLSFLGNDLSNGNDLFAIFLFLLIMLVISIKTYSIFINPILVILGYSLFEIEYVYSDVKRSCLVLSRVTPNEESSYNLNMITTSLFILKEKQNEDD